MPQGIDNVGSLTLSNCEIIGNTFFAEPGGYLTTHVGIEQLSVSGNEGIDGGGIFNKQGQTTVKQLHHRSNSADGPGGGCTICPLLTLTTVP